jgi:excisionase family DNA binding protein
MAEQGEERVGAGSESLWTVKQAAQYLSMSPSYVYKAAQRGRIPCIRIGAAIRFEPAALREWVRAQGEMPAALTKITNAIILNT